MLGCLKSPDMLAPARRREIGGEGRGRGRKGQGGARKCHVSQKR